MKRKILAGVCLGALACAGGATARAQETPQGNTVVGPPQLRDFRLPGERRTPPVQPPVDEPIIQQPRQQTPVPANPRLTPAQPPISERAAPRTTQPRPAPGPASQQPRVRQAAPAPAPGPAMTPAPPPPSPTTPVEAAPPATPLPDPVPEAAPAPLPSPIPAPAETPPPSQAYPYWLYLLPVALALIAAFAWRRRRSAGVQAEQAELEPLASSAPPQLRPEPKPRPWIELEFKPERAAATLTEANVQFQLVVRNSGGSAARNIRIEARMFNAGREQDKEIGAFFRRPPAEVTTTSLPLLNAESETSFRSAVAMPRESMRAVNVQGRTLFVPMVAFNVFYEWGEARRGQTSRSYVVGREMEERAERMAPFRLDLGPRIYRTIGQREHSLARRV